MILVWTDTAKEDMDSIYPYLETKNSKAALDLYNHILSEADILASFPQIAS